MARNYAALPHDYLREMRKLNDAEFGRLCRALLLYSATGETPQLSGREDMFLERVTMQEDRFQESYEEQSARSRNNGRKGGRPRKPTGFPQDPENPQVFSGDLERSENPEVFSETQKTQTKTETETNLSPSTEGESVEPQSGSTAPAPEGKGKKPPKHKYGQYGWVRLSDQEYQRLLKDLGEAELCRCITYIDESAQSSGNKNHWSDWNLVLRRCSREKWGCRGQASSGGYRPANPKMQAGQASSPEVVARQNEQMLRLRAQLTAGEGAAMEREGEYPPRKKEGLEGPKT